MKEEGQEQKKTPLTTYEAAKYLHISGELLRRYVKEGKIPAHFLGRHHLFYIDEIDAAVRKLGHALKDNKAATIVGFMTLPEAAEFLRLSKKQVRDLVAAKKLNAYKPGELLYFKREELNDYITSKPTKAA